MAWLCSSPLTNLWQAGLMPEWLADRPCLNHCHKRHIVYGTERHCNTNTNTPQVGDTLGKPLVCGSSVGLKASVAMKGLLQLLSEKLALCCMYTVPLERISCWSVSFQDPMFPGSLEISLRLWLHKLFYLAKLASWCLTSSITCVCGTVTGIMFPP